MPKIHLDKERLQEVRQNTRIDSAFLSALGIKVSLETASEFKVHSPFSADNTASMHIQKGDGRWYCFSTNQGGGPIELVQKLKGLDCYNAGRFLLDANLSFLEGAGGVIVKETHEAVTITGTPVPSSEGKEIHETASPPENPPIRQNLVPLLTHEHPLFAERGISKATLSYLGAGYLDPADVGEKNFLRDRLVFQIRGVRPDEEGSLSTVILSHIGRASRQEQVTSGKWLFYKGFEKSLEIYNLDHLLFDDEASDQAKTTGQVILVEGCFDAAKLIEAGIKNVGATFGAHLSEPQLKPLRQLNDLLGIKRFLLFYDRDEAGTRGAEAAVPLLEQAGFEASVFPWEARWQTQGRGTISIPQTITDPAEFRVEQLKWLREKKVI